MVFWQMRALLEQDPGLHNSAGWYPPSNHLWRRYMKLSENIRAFFFKRSKKHREGGTWLRPDINGAYTPQRPRQSPDRSFTRSFKTSQDQQQPDRSTTTAFSYHSSSVPSSGILSIFCSSSSLAWTTALAVTAAPTAGAAGGSVVLTFHATSYPITSIGWPTDNLFASAT